MMERMSLMQARAVNQLMKWMYLWIYESGQSIHAVGEDVECSEADGDDEEGHM
jgi:hypothetical protein